MTNLLISRCTRRSEASAHSDHFLLHIYKVDPRRARGRAQLVLGEGHKRVPRGDELGHTVAQEGLSGLQERGVLHDDDLPQARPTGLLGAAGVRVCYPLETRKSHYRPGPLRDHFQKMDLTKHRRARGPARRAAPPAVTGGSRGSSPRSRVRR